MEEEQPLLPLIRYPSLLDAVPIYSVVLDIYDLIVSRIDISLKYDQLKSPQIYAFLVKPLVSVLRDDLSPGTLYGLMANMLQFKKESTTIAAMSGVMETRSIICEIAAIRLLKEYEDEDDLMNALTYDFYPLANGEADSDIIPRWQRISTLELAIKAEAKRFLAHPVVTQVLEEIWSGSVMFQSSMHKLHRARFADEETLVLAAYGRRGPGVRYRYEDASVLKLSRLRVPRYRHVVNTASFYVLLGLYVAVLSRRSKHLDALDVVFWLWSLGFMLDEVVGFSDAGFTLYVMSLWNWFDLIILLLLVTYGGTLFLSYWLNSPDLWVGAHNILGTVAIFLFPRIFSILDNYEIFSQMVVSVKRMMVDLTVACVMIVIFSSGFWVAFTMAFARDIFSARKVAYDLLKILFGFTPTVWDSWSYYSWLGRGMLLFYLFITHFLIMTILIAVLSNSFSAVIANAHEEHQYLFAVNTITMIKSESSSLFSYTAPLNLIEWLIRPLIYCMPLRRFLVLNRTIIKITHFPVLICIFFYERFHLHRLRQAEKQQEKRDAERKAVLKQGLNTRNNSVIQLSDPQSSSPHPVAGYGHRLKRKNQKAAKKKKDQKSARPKVSNDDLLDEVFKRPYKGTIKLKPNINLDGEDTTFGFSYGEHRFSSGNLRFEDDMVNSDPEETTHHFENDSGSDDFEADEEASEQFTIRRRRPRNGYNKSSLRGGWRHRLDRNSQTSDGLTDHLYDFDPVVDIRGQSRIYGVSARNRQFSTSSSLARHGMGTLALSPTRSTASVIERHLRRARGSPSRSRIAMGVSQVEDSALVDDDGADSDEADKISNQVSEELQALTDVLGRRMEGLEKGFRKIEEILAQFSESNESSRSASTARPGP